MNRTELSLGALLVSYVEWEGLDDVDLESLSSRGIAHRDELLPEILELLPRDAEVRTVEEVEYLLSDIDVFEAADFSQVDPDQVAANMGAVVGRQDMSFLLPLAHAGGLEANWVIGGRRQLQIFKGHIAPASNGDGTDNEGSASVGPAEVVCLSGIVQAGHWGPARRMALSAGEEVAGILMALGFLQPNPVVNREHTHYDVFRRLAARLRYHFKGAERDQVVQLPWHIQYHVWQSRIDVPRYLTDLERREIGEAGAAVFSKRLRLLQAPFVVGGENAKRVRRAARFLRKAATVESPGDAYLFMATALEGLLVEAGGDLERRVCDAVAVLVGSTYHERERVRKLAGRLYNVRSRYIHEGEYQGSDMERLEALALVSKVIAHEVGVLSDSGVAE